MVKQYISKHVIGAMICVLLCITYLIYPLANFHLKTLINTVCLIIYFISSIIVYLVMRKNKNYTLYWILIFLGLAIFITGDILLYIKEITHQNIDNVNSTYILFLISSILFFLASINLFKKSKPFENLAKHKGILDIVLIFALYAFLILTSIKPIKDLLMLFPECSTYFLLSIVIDFLCLFNLSIMYVCNVKDFKQNKVVFGTLLAVLFYTLGDLLYINTVLNGDFISDTFIDLFRLLSLLFFTLTTIFTFNLQKNINRINTLLDLKDKSITPYNNRN